MKAIKRFERLGDRCFQLTSLKSYSDINTHVTKSDCVANTHGWVCKKYITYIFEIWRFEFI